MYYLSVQLTSQTANTDGIVLLGAGLRLQLFQEAGVSAHIVSQILIVAVYLQVLREVAYCYF